MFGLASRQKLRLPLLAIAILASLWLLTDWIVPPTSAWVPIADGETITDTAGHGIASGAAVRADLLTDSVSAEGFSADGRSRLVPALGTAQGLQVQKSAPATVSPGSAITYTISYANVDGRTMQAVLIHDRIPTDTIFLGSAGGISRTLQGQLVSWYLGHLAPGDSGSVRLVIRVPARMAAGTSIVNCAWITSPNSISPVYNCATTSVLSPPATATRTPITEHRVYLPVMIKTGWGGPTRTATSTSSPSSTASPTATSTSKPTTTATATSTGMRTATSTSTSTGTPTATPTSTSTSMPTATRTSTSTSGPTLTPTLTPTPTSSPQACAPSLISPEPGAVMDNARRDGLDNKVWDFDWSDCAGATAYNLYVIGPTSTSAMIDRNDLVGSFYHYESGSYIADSNRFGWTWKVRARVGGQWGEWSESRHFDVEPVDTDPPAGTPSATPSPTSTGTVLATRTATATSTRTSTPTATQTSTRTPTATSEPEPTEIGYDDGTAESSQSWEVGKGFAVCFNSPGAGHLLLRARFYLLNPAPIQVYAWHYNWSELTTPFIAYPSSDGWFEVDFSDRNVILPDYTFFVGFTYTVDYQPDIGVDTNGPFGCSFEVDGDYHERHLDMDYMIRATVQ